MRSIMFSLPDGRLCIMHPVKNTFPFPEAITDAAAEERAWNTLPSEALNPTWISRDQIPGDRTFRNGWEAKDGSISFNLDKCKEIHRDKLRRLRAPKLLVLDVQYMLADERGDVTTKREIAAQKQVLRDITALPEIEAAKTPDELKRILPQVLQE